MKSRAGYGNLLADSHFQAFLWTQFLGAFNDNVYKMIVSILAVRIAVDGSSSSLYLALAGAVFVIPFLLFAGYAGQLADRFSKTRVLQVTKSFEILVMLMGILALASARMELLLVVLFLLAAQATFFSPAKYGILPEMMDEARLSRANGLLELSTFVAIVIGTSFGTFLFELWRGRPLRMAMTLLAIAVAGSLASLHIRKVPAAGSDEPFRSNPFHEIVKGARSLRTRKTLAFSVLGISWFWFVGALFQMAVLLAAKEMLHVPEARVGLLVTALAAGIGLGSILAGTLSGDHIDLGLVPLGSA
ncbi:MAG: AMP-dependent synthetase and ligase, partial [Bryobacterales bacterium]|nr:AMP-dependent synthetase and ligase [Bryobacterales bacterium]